MDSSFVDGDLVRGIEISPKWKHVYGEETCILTCNILNFSDQDFQDLELIFPGTNFLDEKVTEIELLPLHEPEDLGLVIEIEVAVKYGSKIENITPEYALFLRSKNQEKKTIYAGNFRRNIHSFAHPTICKFRPPTNYTSDKYNILMFGSVGSAKSSMINSFYTMLHPKGLICQPGFNCHSQRSDITPEKWIGTTKIQRFEYLKKDGISLSEDYSFRVTDTWGQDQNNYDRFTFLSILNGELPGSWEMGSDESLFEKAKEVRRDLIIDMSPMRKIHGVIYCIQYEDLDHIFDPKKSSQQQQHLIIKKKKKEEEESEGESDDEEEKEKEEKPSPINIQTKSEKEEENGIVKYFNKIRYDYGVEPMVVISKTDAVDPLFRSTTTVTEEMEIKREKLADILQISEDDILFGLNYTVERKPVFEINRLNFAILYRVLVKCESMFKLISDPIILQKEEQEQENQPIILPPVDDDDNSKEKDDVNMMDGEEEEEEEIDEEEEKRMLEYERRMEEKRKEDDFMDSLFLTKIFQQPLTTTTTKNEEISTWKGEVEKIITSSPLKMHEYFLSSTHGEEEGSNFFKHVLEPLILDNLLMLDGFEELILRLLNCTYLSTFDSEIGSVVVFPSQLASDRTVPKNPKKSEFYRNTVSMVFGKIGFMEKLIDRYFKNGKDLEMRARVRYILMEMMKRSMNSGKARKPHPILRFSIAMYEGDIDYSEYRANPCCSLLFKNMIGEIGKLGLEEEVGILRFLNCLISTLMFYDKHASILKFLDPYVLFLLEKVLQTPRASLANPNVPVLGEARLEVCVVLTNLFRKGTLSKSFGEEYHTKLLKYPRILKHLCDLFFDFPNNNIFQYHFCQIIRMIVKKSKFENHPKFHQILFIDEQFIKRLLENIDHHHQEVCCNHSGIMGHIYKISNMIHSSELTTTYLSQTLDPELFKKWTKYTSEDLGKVNIQQNITLGDEGGEEEYARKMMSLGIKTKVMVDDEGAKPNTHIVVMVVVKDENAKFLLVQESKAVCHGKWYLPAGRVRPGENIQDGAVREVKEESGLGSLMILIHLIHLTYYYMVEIEVLGVFKIEDDPGKNDFWIRFLMRGKVVGGQLKSLEDADEDSLMAKFYSLEEIELLEKKEKIRANDLIYVIKNSMDQVGEIEYTGNLLEK